jgi:CheY-like chemotaxis protein
VIHELVTNSAKYGGLSDSGRAQIAWRLNERGDLLLDWTESGGPPVKPPSRKGFGSTIIDRSVPYDLGGESSIEFRPEGVHAHFRIPARHVSVPRDHSGPLIRFPRPVPTINGPVPEQVIKGANVLLVEDSLIIALDAEDILKRLGAAHVATGATVEGALDTIRAARPTLAVLDINLGDQTSYAVADRLHELGVPFLFATGYGEKADLPPDHVDRRVLQKPYTLENMARALAELVGAEPTGTEEEAPA